MADGKNPETNFFTEPVSRRTALRRIGKLVGAGVGLALGFHPDKNAQARIARPPEFKPFADLLSDEQLEQSHIRIIQTPGVILHLRQGIFDFPLFRDAKEGKLKEAVIVLVNEPKITWNSSLNMPEDARLVWQAVNLDPRVHFNEYFPLKKKHVEETYEYWRRQQSEALEMLQKAPNHEMRLREEQFSIAVDATQKYVKKLITLLGDRETIIAAESAGDLDEGETLGAIARLDVDPRQEPSYRNAAIKHPVLARIFEQNYRNLLQNHPELKDKVFIYLAVGGSRSPKPDQSYPKPDQLKEYGIENGNFYRYYGNLTVGTSLRHESSHYVPGAPTAGEYKADTGMFESIKAAWEKKQKGDDSGYPFVFINKEGMTVTKNISPQASEEKTV